MSQGRQGLFNLLKTAFSGNRNKSSAAVGATTKNRFKKKQLDTKKSALEPVDTLKK